MSFVDLIDAVKGNFNDQGNKYYNPVIKDDIPVGCFVIIGSANNGKTTFAKNVAQEEGSLYIGCNEPDENLMLNDSQLAKTIIDHNDQKILIINSLKRMMYDGEKTSSIASEGVFTNLFSNITALSQYARSIGQQIYVVVPIIANAFKLVEQIKFSSTGWFSVENQYITYSIRGYKERETLGLDFRQASLKFDAEPRNILE
jgi:hypothetical protein